ncbi:hypothetical protein ACW4YW_15425 [Methylobacillus pratensis]
MKKTRDQLIVEIDVLLARTQLPLTTEDIQNGWTLAAQQSAIKFLEKLRPQVDSEEQLPPMNLARALDSWGVVSGDLLNGYAELSNGLRDL